MKYGLLVHKPTKNLGDDIQSYAIERFLPHVDYLIDREQIHNFSGDEDEPVAVVMAAWWMWNKWNWPPSKSIYPYFVGFHYSDNEAAKQAGCPVDYDFLTGIGARYLNAYGPIGCRDYFTRDKLRKNHVKAEFSGCITLTLPQQEKKDMGDYIVLVDVQKDVEAAIEKKAKKAGIEVKKITHNLDRKAHMEKTWEERSKNVEETLTIYQNARCVVTRRLHCALPCLAMGVPTLLVIHTLESVRFIPYYDWLYCCLPEQFLNGEFEYDVTNPPQNKQLHLETRSNLIQSVSDFVAGAQKMENSERKMRRFRCSDKRIEKWRLKKLKNTNKVWDEELKQERERIDELLERCKGALRYEELLGEIKKEDSTHKKRLKKYNNELHAKQEGLDKKLLKAQLSRLETEYYEKVMHEDLRHMRKQYDFIKQLEKWDTIIQKRKQ